MTQRSAFSRQQDGKPSGGEEIDDALFIMCTSGTTGRPKGAGLTHGNTLWNGINGQLADKLSRKETIPVASPLYHIAGSPSEPLPASSAGKDNSEPVLRPREGPRTDREHRVNIMFGIPTMFEMMADSERFDRTDFSSVWCHTGDVGYFGPEGCLYITDRVNDMLISGGENRSSRRGPAA